MKNEKNPTYFLDSVSGSDRNDGLTPDHAWKTIDRLNAEKLAPGATVSLRGGHVFFGTIRIPPGVSGLTVSSFGEGRATLYAGAEDAITLNGTHGVTIRNLTAVGCGRKAGSDGAGIVATDCTDARIEDVEVHGFRVAGIAVKGGTRITLERVVARDNGAAGISVNQGSEVARDVVIRDCVAHSNAGDPQRLDNHSGNGIVVGGLDGCLIEFCRAYNNGYDMPRTGNGPVGIWGYAAHNLTIQYCISHDNKTSPGGMDGGGFDFDGGITDSVLQYNLSYNNHGSGYLLCQYPGAAPWKNNRCRFNISINDGRTNHFAGIHFWAGDAGISDARVSHNLVINDRHAVTATHDIPGLVMKNNILIAEDTVIAGPLTTTAFSHNHVWSRRAKGVFTDGKSEPVELDEWTAGGGDPNATTGDPRVVLPSILAELPTDPRDLRCMPWARLSADSPIRGVAEGEPAGGEHDLFGNPVESPRSPGVDQGRAPR